VAAGEAIGDDFESVMPRPLAEANVVLVLPADEEVERRGESA
jgi:hypothetical protein